MFLQPQLAPYCFITCSMLKCFFNLSSHLTVLLHVRCSHVSSTSARTLLFYYTFDAQKFLQTQLAPYCFITRSMLKRFFNLSSHLIVLLRVRCSHVSSTSACTLLFYYMLDAHMFLQPQLAPYCFIKRSMLKCFFNLSSHLIVLLHVRCSKVSSNSGRTLLFYYMLDAHMFLQPQLAPPVSYFLDRLTL
jgi:hypothetical protein